MDFAADAVFDVATPPARQAPARAPTATSNDEPSFDEHLEAATETDDVSESTAPTDQAPREHTQQDTPTDSECASPSTDAAPTAAPPAQPSPDQTAAPVLVQMIVAAEPSQPNAPQQAAPTNASAPVDAPSAPAPTAPAPDQTAAAPQDMAGPAPVTGEAQPKAKPSQKDAAPSDKTAQPTAQTTSAAAPTTDATTAPVVVPTQAAATAAAAPAPTETVDLAALGATPPAQPQATPEHVARQQKSATARGEAKPEASEATDSATPPTTAPPRANAATKSAAPQNAGKDAIAFTPVETADAAPQPQQAAAPAASTSQSAHVQQASSDAARVAPAAHQVAREIVRKFDGGSTKFELRLDPADLGRVEVKLEVSRDHRVTAVITADSPQALSELARNSRDLEQMLQSAGLELSDSGLSFDLRQGNEGAETPEFRGSAAEGAATLEDTTPVAARPLGYERWRGVRVDMMV